MVAASAGSKEGKRFELELNGYGRAGTIMIGSMP
jgi:hypothetical protein